jgi:hypothetical protein
MPDYSLGKIYAIRSPHTDLIYIGSTTQKYLSSRFTQHTKYTRHDERKTREHSYTVIDFGDAYIELLEECPCENKQQLLKREGELIRSTANCVNHCKQVGKPIKEQIEIYREEHKEIKKLTDKKYYEEKKEEIKRKKKKHYAENKEQEREKCNLIYQKNKDKIRNQQRIYREKNREKINEQQKINWAKNKDKLSIQQRIYREKIRDKINEQQKINRAKNEEKEITI